MAKKINVECPRFSWPLFVKGYLHSALLNMEKLKSLVEGKEIKKPTKDGTIENQEELLWVEYKMNYFHLWMPTIFLIRHACELLVKSVSINIYKEFILNHNLEILLNQIKEEDKEKNFFGKDFELFENICRKYFSYTFGNGPVTDPDGFTDEYNMFFRYPENFMGQNSIILNLEYFSVVDDQKINSFITDIKILNDLVDRFGATIGYLESMQSNGMTAEEIEETKNIWEEVLNKRSREAGAK